MDKAEFTEIVRTYQKQLLVIAFHYCGNRDDAEDVVQDVFVRLRAPMEAADRVPGYLAEHVRGDVVLEGTVEGLHLIYTNLLAENRFLYLEVLAEREDGKPIDAEALQSDMFFKYLVLSDYETARDVLFPPDGEYPVE